MGPLVLSDDWFSQSERSILGQGQLINGGSLWRVKMNRQSRVWNDIGISDGTILSKSLEIGEMAHFRSSASNASHLSAASQTTFRGGLVFVERLFGPNSPPEGLLIPQ
jgi:hypothetical protein